MQLLWKRFGIRNGRLLSRNSNDSLYKCFIGSISIYTFGGAMPFTFVLNGDTISNNVSGLNPGSHSLFVMDANGCVQEETIFIDNLSTVGFEAIDLELNAYINNNRAIVNTTNPNIDHIELFNISGSNVS